MQVKKSPLTDKTSLFTTLDLVSLPWRHFWSDLRNICIWRNYSEIKTDTLCFEHGAASASESGHKQQTDKRQAEHNKHETSIRNKNITE